MTNVLTASFSHTKQTLIRSTSALLTRAHARTAKGFHLHCSMLSSEVKLTQSEWVLYIQVQSYVALLQYKKHPPVDSSQGAFGSRLRPVGFGLSGHINICRNRRIQSQTPVEMSSLCILKARSRQGYNRYQKLELLKTRLHFILQKANIPKKCWLI